MVKRTLEKEEKESHFRVSIFGSARIEKNSETYRQVYDLAKRLASRGIDIVTGGGPGLMEAANRGHKAGRKNKKTHSIGLAIKLPKEQRINDSLDIVKTFNTFSKRLDNFMLLSNAVIIAPGGIGTALEFFYTWQLVQTRKICSIPIILLGDFWMGLIKWIEKHQLKYNFIEKHDLKHILVAEDNKEAVRMVLKTFNEYKKNKNFCINSKKYKI